MIHFVLSALWDSAFAQFGLAGLALIGAVAVFLWVPLPGARHAAVAVATVAVIFLFLAPKLYVEGIRHEKARWDVAEAAAVDRAARARAEAEREIAPVAPRPASAAAPDRPAADDTGHGRAVARILHRRGSRSDPYDRDNR
jgi:hypothetical protein